MPWKVVPCLAAHPVCWVSYILCSYFEERREPCASPQSWLLSASPFPSRRHFPHYISTASAGGHAMRGLVGDCHKPRTGAVAVLTWQRNRSTAEARGSAGRRWLAGWYRRSAQLWEAGALERGGFRGHIRWFGELSAARWRESETWWRA